MVTDRILDDVIKDEHRCLVDNTFGIPRRKLVVESFVVVT